MWALKLKCCPLFQHVLEFPEILTINQLKAAQKICIVCILLMISMSWIICLALAAYQEPCSEWVSAHGAAAGEEIEL